MIEKTHNIPTPDGEMETFTACPDGDGPFPVVVLYMDAPGIRGELYDFGRRIAGEGYYALVPDLYYRRGRVRLDMTRPGARKLMYSHMDSLSNAAVAADSEAIFEFLASEPNAAPGPKGCIGHCMSGQFIATLAGSFPDDFRASVSCYGVRIVTDEPDSPHKLLARARGEIFFAFAETDDHVPDATIQVLRETLEGASVESVVKIYPNTEHGFCFPERKQVYAATAAEDVWRRTFEIFERQLRQS
ncbi:MAG: dienelactone hydrolase family protein [Myxococcota bacterium]|nr:dienelactone hydrolase family protein [Myxococcota bacterium]